MKIVHLGTAAAERIPAIFCECRVCRSARSTGGTEVRTQCQSLIDDRVLIDFGGDSYLHAHEQGISLGQITVLLVTHWHSDHFYAEDLAYRMSGYGHNLYDCLDVYGTREVSRFFDRAMELEGRRDPGRLAFHVIQPGDVFEVLGGAYTVCAFEAAHGRNDGDCVFYGVSDGSRSLLYAHDTGPLSQSAWDQIRAAGVVYDYVSLDCTFGGEVPDLGVGIDLSTLHMALPDNASVKEQLLGHGLARPTTRWVANHISHNAGSTHSELQHMAQAYGIDVAYDGMINSF